MSVYAITDLHGRYDLWSMVKNYLTDDDILYCLGDCIDRGHYGYDIISEMMDMPNVHLIMGNHEQMMVDTLMRDNWWRIEANQLWDMNGGKYTLWQIEEKLSTPEDDSQVKMFAEEVQRFAKTLFYKNIKGQMIILNHCGFTPGNGYEPYWDRHHFGDCWPDESILSEDMCNTYIIHGHTPVQAMNKYHYKYWYDKTKVVENNIKEDIGEDRNIKVRVLKYCDGHKINLDLGSVTSDTTVLLDLDTFEEIYFYKKYELDDIDKAEQEIAEHEAKISGFSDKDWALASLFI